MVDKGRAKKTVVSKIRNLSSTPTTVSRMMSIIAKRLKNSWGYILYHNQTLDNIRIFIDKANVVLHHKIDGHKYCKL